MTHSPRHYSRLDQFFIRVDEALRTLNGNTTLSARGYPAQHIPEAELSASEKKHIAGLMRVNQAGEVSAQALYHGQGIVSRDPAVKKQMRAAANEEGDHLAWCNRRLTELNSQTSLLNPIWYAGSFLIGVAAGAVSDKCSLGFVAETETQVVNHLQRHLEMLPEKDKKSAEILRQMQADEARHHADATKAGAIELPAIVKKLMRLTSKIMVKTAYWF
jgi:ubiquinone biosynthesis monooxygenase Coq7